MKTRRIITTIAIALACGGGAFAAFGLNDVAQGLAKKTAEDAAAGNPYAMILLVAVFGIAGFLLALNQFAAAWDKLRGKSTAKTADPVVLEKLDRLHEELARYMERTDELWDDMNRRHGAEEAES